jgi:hypothetical protein
VARQNTLVKKTIIYLIAEGLDFTLPKSLYAFIKQKSRFDPHLPLIGASPECFWDCVWVGVMDQAEQG